MKIQGLLLAFVTLIFSPQLFALEHVEHLDCADAMASTKTYEIAKGHLVTLTTDQILLRGHLEAWNEQGMEDFVAWSVDDDIGKKRILQSSNHAIFPLKKGDHVFILNNDNQILYEGFFDERVLSYKDVIEGREVEFAANFPLLNKSSDSKDTVLPNETLAHLFNTGARAVVIKTLSAVEKRNIKAHLIPQLKAYADHQKNPERFLTFADGHQYELAHYETSFEGMFSAHQGSASSPLNFDIFIDGRVGGRIEHLHYGDRVFLIDTMGRVVDQGECWSANGIDHLDHSKSLVELQSSVKRAKRIVVIRPRRP